MQLGDLLISSYQSPLGGTSATYNLGKKGMSGDILGTPADAKRRRKAIWITTGVLVLITAGTIATFATMNAGGGGSSPGAASPTPVVTATPAPAGPATAVGELDDDEALLTIETALAAPIGSVGTSADLEALLKDVAVDSYAAELEAQWQELVSQGWSIQGSPTLVSSDVTSMKADAAVPTAEVTACIDSSAVSMLDADGKPIGDASAKTPRALHLFTLVQGTDDIWRIASHSFPNDPTC
jgi:hypothetical protein